VDGAGRAALQAASTSSHVRTSGWHRTMRGREVEDEAGTEPEAGGTEVLVGAAEAMEDA
jgi:hypothetical protein